MREKKALSAILFAIGLSLVIGVYVDVYPHLREQPRSVEISQHINPVLKRTVLIGTIAGGLLILLAIVIGVGSRPFSGNKATSSDHTERLRQQLIREADKKLEHASQILKKTTEEVNAMSYSISHDLKAPLRAIKGFSEILMEEHFSHLPTSGQKALTIIQQNASRMDDLLEDVLRMAKVGSVVPDKQRINMQQLVNDVASSFAKKENVTLTVNPLRDCVGDYRLLKQLWEILLSNAVKFSSRKEVAVIEIGCEQSGNNHIYWIKDNGVGFDPQYSDKLFKLFSRLHPKKEFEGNGAGLAIARKIVELHGGTISSESMPNDGAHFWFTVPTDA